MPAGLDGPAKNLTSPAHAPPVTLQVGCAANSTSPVDTAEQEGVPVSLHDSMSLTTTEYGLVTAGPLQAAVICPGLIEMPHTTVELEPPPPLTYCLAHEQYSCAVPTTLYVPNTPFVCMLPYPVNPDEVCSTEVPFGA